MPDRVYKALLIGNATFPDDPENLPDLRGPYRDIQHLQEALTHRTYGLFDPGNVAVVWDKPRQPIVKEMGHFFQSAGRDDQLLMYYTGHGYVDVNNFYYLCTRDTDTRAIETAIRDEEVNGMMQRSTAPALVLILDCCYSGRWKSVPRFTERLKAKGRFVITSSLAGQLSADAKAVDEASPFTKYLVEGMTSDSLLPNESGYVTLDALYSFVSQQLHQAGHQQQPQRNFDDAVGDVALARRAGMGVRVSAARRKPVASPPRLYVSEKRIEITDLHPDETPLQEVIDVFNKGGGTLDWTVESDANWIEVVRKSDTCFRMTLRPGPGINRGKVHVRESTLGQSEVVRVTVTMLQQEPPPRLIVAPAVLDFGSLSVGELSPTLTVQLINTGGGVLGARASTTSPRVLLEELPEALQVHLDTRVTGEVDGSITVTSNGGSATVSVRGLVGPGPVLRLDPAQLDFGEVQEGHPRGATVRVQNAGSGDLRWDYGYSGDFFTVERGPNALRIQLDPRPGRHVGSLWVQSNGGEATIDVRASMAPTEDPIRLVTAAPRRYAQHVRAGPSAGSVRDSWQEEQLRKAGARVYAGSYYGHTPWWVLSTLSIALTVAATSLIDPLIRRLAAGGAASLIDPLIRRWGAGRSVGMFTFEIPPIGSAWLMLGLSGLLVAVVQIALATANWSDDPSVGWTRPFVGRARAGVIAWAVLAAGWAGAAAAALGARDLTGASYEHVAGLTFGLETAVVTLTLARANLPYLLTLQRAKRSFDRQWWDERRNAGRPSPGQPAAPEWRPWQPPTPPAVEQLGNAHRLLQLAREQGLLSVDVREFWERPNWWIAASLTVVVLSAGVAATEPVLRWIEGIFNFTLPNVSLSWVLILAGGLWAIRYLFFSMDPHPPTMLGFLRDGLLRGWKDILFGYDSLYVVLGSASAFPLNLWIAWALARGLALIPFSLLGWSYSLITVLAFAGFTLLCFAASVLEAGL